MGQQLSLNEAARKFDTGGSFLYRMTRYGLLPKINPYEDRFRYIKVDEEHVPYSIGFRKFLLDRTEEGEFGAWPYEMMAIPGVYFVLSDEFVKVGKAKDLSKRIGQLQTSHPHTLYLLAWADGGSMQEAAFHKEFNCCWSRGEWFRASCLKIRKRVRELNSARLLE